MPGFAHEPGGSLTEDLAGLSPGTVVAESADAVGAKSASPDAPSPSSLTAPVPRSKAAAVSLRPRSAADGMMHNTVVKSDMHAVDTHGVTPLTFAAMHFLGIFFAPRIAGLDKRRLYSFRKRKAYQDKGYRLLPDSSINTEIIKEHWDDIGYS